MYRELPVCIWMYKYLCTGSCLGVSRYTNMYVHSAAWVYLDIKYLCTVCCLGVSRYTNIYVQGAAWVYLLLGSAGQGEGGCTGEDRVSASSGIASGTSSQPWLEDQVFIYSLITLEH